MLVPLITKVIMFLSCIANSGGTRQWVAIAFNNWLGVYLKGMHMQTPQVMSTHIIYTRLYYHSKKWLCAWPPFSG